MNCVSNQIWAETSKGSLKSKFKWQFQLNSVFKKKDSEISVNLLFCLQIQFAYSEFLNFYEDVMILKIHFEIYPQLRLERIEFKKGKCFKSAIE